MAFLRMTTCMHRNVHEFRAPHRGRVDTRAQLAGLLCDCHWRGGRLRWTMRCARDALTACVPGHKYLFSGGCCSASKFCSAEPDETD